MNKEIINAIKSTKTVDELKEVAAKKGYPLTNEEANGYFEMYHTNGKIADKELDNVSGGACSNLKQYSDDSHHYLIVTWGNSCPAQVDNNNYLGVPGTCLKCTYRLRDEDDGFLTYCSIRTLTNDPYNKTKTAIIDGDK